MSLRARLVVAMCVVAVVALATAGTAAYTAFSSSQLRQIDDDLQRSHQPIEEVVDRGSPDLKEAIEQVAPGLYVALIDTDGETVLTIAARTPGDDPVLADLSSVEMAPTQNDSRIGDDPVFSTVRSDDGDGDEDSDVRIRTSRLSDGSVLVIGLSLHETSESGRRLIVIEVAVAALALVVAAFVGWLLVGVGLRPLRRVEQTALMIADSGTLDQDVPGVDRSTEIGRLAGALNTMLARIREAFSERDRTEEALRESEATMRRFVADVSHELRTPLSAVTAYAELFERGARDHPEDLERALRGIGLEAARMRDLVEELLLLAHLDEGRPLAMARVDLNEVVVDAISAARAVSPEWPITLRVADVVVVEGDASRLRQVVDNLLSNVRTHTPPGTTTAVELGIEADHGVLTIGDDGPGMATDHAAHVFERFFRADPSRSRSSGGAGLGMAIVHGLVTAHAGTIALRTAPGAGFTTVTRLPLADRRTQQADQEER